MARPRRTSPAKYLLRTQLLPARHLAHARPGHQRLGNNPRLLRCRPAPSPHRPSQNLHTSEGALRVVANVIHNVSSKTLHSADQAQSDGCRKKGLRTPLTLNQLLKAAIGVEPRRPAAKGCSSRPPLWDFSTAIHGSPAREPGNPTMRAAYRPVFVLPLGDFSTSATEIWPRTRGPT